MEADELRSALPGVALWRALGLPDSAAIAKLEGGAKSVKICSPFRPDKNPSFSIQISDKDGSIICTDWSSSETLNDWDLIAKVKGIDPGDKPAVMKAWHDLAGVSWKDGTPVKKKTAKKQAPVKLQAPPVQQSVQGPRERIEKPDKASGQSKVVAVYDYTAADGSLLHQTLRYEPKQFKQRRKPLAHESGEWIWSLSGGKIVPYKLPEIVAQPMATILLVEGEKDADAAASLLSGRNIVVSTLPMGCGKWRSEYEQYFVGRNVCVLADFDEPKDGKAAGFEGALKISQVLRDICKRVGLLELTTLWPEAPYGADISDWIERGKAADAAKAEMADKLQDAVMSASLPKGIVYEGCVTAGQRGLKCYEDLLARRLVNDEQLIFSAASFWRYDDRGLWRREPDTLGIEATIREALTVIGASELITKSRVSSILGLAKSVRHCPVEHMNKQPAGCINLKNGVLDTRTGELMPHNADWMMQTRIPHAWDPYALCAKWLEWLEDRIPDPETRAAIQEMFGYVLATDINFHVFFFLFGDGGTGKSTCVSVLEALVGEENRVSIQLEELDNAFMRSQLAGKALYLCKELTTKSFEHIGLIKAIVSGDPIPVDVKYAQPYDFRPFGKMVMESNVIASTPDSSAGFTRRFVQIDFEKPISRDKMDFNLLDKFKEEMPGILAWAMKGLKRLRMRGHFALTQKAEQSRDQLMRHRAQVGSFIDSGYVYEHPDCRVSTQYLYHLYQQWCEEYDVVPFYRECSTFMREVMTKKPEWRERKQRVRTNDGREWVIDGLALRDDLAVN